MAGNAPAFSALVSSVLEHAKVLSAAAEMELATEISDTDLAVRQMLKRASDLVRGAAAMGDQRNPIALGVLSRRDS